jgi:apolipoprotein D and lipocalin family protein
MAMPEQKTVALVDAKRYMGTWYEIARFPQKFEKDLVGVTATYTLMPDGKVGVLNSGYKGGLDGEFKTAKGKAKVVDTTTNAKLKVTFFWPFYADYWILELGDNYEYAMIGGPSTKYLWILSRTSQMDEKVYGSLVQKAKDRGYDISKLEKVPQKTASK